MSDFKFVSRKLTEMGFGITSVSSSTFWKNFIDRLRSKSQDQDNKHVVSIWASAGFRDNRYRSTRTIESAEQLDLMGISSESDVSVIDVRGILELK